MTSGPVADRLRGGLIPLAVLIGLTAYVASDDIAVSFVFTAALGPTALGAAWLLLRGMRGRIALGSAAAHGTTTHSVVMCTGSGAAPW